MASWRLVSLLAVWTVVLVLAQCCPEPCSCLDKYSHQFADCAYKDLLLVPVGLPFNVTTLSLSANKIKLLKAKSFINVTQVTSLWLAHNEIVTMERDTLAPLIQLRNLDLSYNKIINFPWEDLANLTALQLLKMNNNEMINLPKDSFSTLKDLRSLRINNNRFTTIVQGTFSSLSSMSHLQIYNNPFTCSCSLEWLRDWITESKISVPEQDSIVCEAPEHLKGALVTKMPKLECKAPTVSITYQPNLENTELYEGFMVILNCDTKGNPKPEVSWEVVKAGNQKFTFSLPSEVSEKSDSPINDKTTNGRFLVFQNGTLIIPRISKKEDGNYSCSAVNDLGKADSTVKVVVAVTKKQAINSMLDTTADKILRPSGGNKPGPKMTNNIINWPKSDSEKTKNVPTGSSVKHADGSVQAGEGSEELPFTSKCGISDGTQYISNHAFNLSLDQLKQYTFDFGVIALEVSETEAKVQLNPLQLPNSKNNLHLSHNENLETVDKEPFSLYQASTKTPLDMLYLCFNTGNGHSVVQWSRIEEGINTYKFQGLQPGTNYTLCLTYGGQDCQVQVVFTTRKKIPSLLIIVVVSTFLLALATVPLLGATCCHLLYKYQGKTYKLIMKAAQKNPDQMDKHMVGGDFDPRASFVELEKNFNPSEMEDGEGEDGEDADGEEVEGSMVTESIPGSTSKFEVGSEYSDRLPLGAEAVNISEDGNGNYKEPSR
ncbi:immunoglobulin superfamily containing leucine-rich repeat protein 2 [Oncorhynchus keta]|uniref:immunoglobulin superfamily containing leucine-rich repeat protein 2 n=1 Tax=Oncorhynchus keta TaxID=8018 RepID=UPI0015FCDDE7|nr:immunoglobulin superfamily containing leucine-rich repeat protein 2 [Oncorhynchus keta]